MRPSPPPRVPVAVVAASRLDALQAWVARHRLLTGAVAIVCVVAVAKGYQRSRWLRKTRRARRARNGARTEVVVVAGSPTLPLTKSLALDMERRGFIVYIVCNASEDEGLVHAYARPDIRPLALDTTDVRWLLLAVGPRCAPSPLTLASPPVPAPPSSASPPTCSRRAPRGPT